MDTIQIRRGIASDAPALTAFATRTFAEAFGADNRPEARFCGDCGQPLTPGAAAAVATTTPPPTQSTPGGAAERRLVSVLFADLVAFTSYSEGRDPETVRETLTRYFEATREVIGRHGGVVAKFIGDAVMAWWGATTSQEDDAERAVRAALEVVERLVERCPYDRAGSDAGDQGGRVRADERRV